MTYQRLVDRPPMTVAFDSVIWPNDLALPWVKSDYDLLVERQGEPVQYGENGSPPSTNLPLPRNLRWNI